MSSSQIVTASKNVEVRQEERIVDIKEEFVTLKMPVAIAQVLYGILGTTNGSIGATLYEALFQAFGKRASKLPLSGYVYKNLKTMKMNQIEGKEEFTTLLEKVTVESQK